MLDNLTQRFSRVVKELRGQARLTDDNIQDALREVRLALLEAENAGAVAAFAAHVGKQPEDRLAAFHLKRLLNGAKGSRIAILGVPLRMFVEFQRHYRYGQIQCFCQTAGVILNQFCGAGRAYQHGFGEAAREDP